MHGARLPTSRSFGFRMDLYDIACAIGAPPLAVIAANNSYVLDVFDIAYVVIALFVSLFIFYFARIGADLHEYFSIRDAVRIGKASFGVAVITAGFMFPLGRLAGIMVSLPALHFSILFLLLISGRWIARERHASMHAPVQGEVEEKVVIVGTGDLAWLYIRALESVRSNRRVVGLVDLQDAKIGRFLAGHAVLGSAEDLPMLIEEMKVHGVVITMIVVAVPEAERAEKLDGILRRSSKIYSLKVEVLSERLMGVFGTCAVDERAVLKHGAKANYWKVKRILDVVVSFLLILCLLPFFALVAAATAISFGFPVVFWQERSGRFGNSISVHKFRTMRGLFDEDGNRRPDCDRETAVGRFLRASRLDELPQLFNVLRGDMSLIGPRPLLPRDQPDDARGRLSVSPGITGWAQVHGGRVISAERKNELDLWYIENASLLLDAKIVFLTARAILIGDHGAAARVVGPQETETAPEQPEGGLP
jgi:lipopolysaccharide/colanic/teichoic acid biosynthesis glycosyltransferase